MKSVFPVKSADVVVNIVRYLLNERTYEHYLNIVFFAGNNRVLKASYFSGANGKC